MTNDPIPSARHRRDHRCLAAIIVATMTLGLSDAAPVAAQNSPVPAPCNGGPPGVSAFRVRKIGASLAILEATQEQQTVSGQFIAQRNWNVGSESSLACGWSYQRTLADISASYDGKKSASGALNITRNYSGRIQQLMFLKSNASFAYATADLYSNNSLGIKLTQSYGGGLGYARGPFEVEGDLRFINERYLPPGNGEHLVGLGLGGRYDFSLEELLPAADLTVAATFVPVLNQSESWQANSTVELFLPFKSGTWGVTFGAQDNYIRNAPTGFRRNYFKTAVGLAYATK